MRIKFVSGPHAGEARHCERNWIIDLLIDAGILEHAPQLVDSIPPIPVQKQPTWSIRTGDATGRHFIQYTAASGETMIFDGLPERALHAFKRVGADVPENVVESYRHALGEPARLAAAWQAAQVADQKRGLR